MLIFAIAFAACSKKDKTKPGTTSSNFYHGNLLGSPSTIIGPSNAILLRDNGTMREYANDYYSTGTGMTAKDTASSKVKLDGTYTTTTHEGITTIAASWYRSDGSPALTYTLVGTVTGNKLDGALTAVGTGISTVTQFTFTNVP